MMKKRTKTNPTQKKFLGEKIFWEKKYSTKRKSSSSFKNKITNCVKIRKKSKTKTTFIYQKYAHDLQLIKNIQ